VLGYDEMHTMAKNASDDDHLLHADTRMANRCPDDVFYRARTPKRQNGVRKASTGIAGAIYAPRRLVARGFTGHRRPSTTKRAGCGQGPRAP